MEINLDNFEESINDVSYIIENKDQQFDLEESIAQCITEINNEIGKKHKKLNNTRIIIKKTNSRTHSHNYNNQKNIINTANKILEKKKEEKNNENNIIVSKEEIENIKNQIINIFNENSEKIKKIQEEQIENDKKMEENLIEGRKIYEEEIDKLYNEKINKIIELDNKYKNDIFELKDFVYDEMKGRERQKSNLQQILDSVTNDKENELKKLEEEFHKEEKKIKKKYKNINNNNEDISLDNKSVILKNQIYDNFKSRINEVINEKKISNN